MSERVKIFIPDYTQIYPSWWANMIAYISEKHGDRFLTRKMIVEGFAEFGVIAEPEEEDYPALWTTTFENEIAYIHFIMRFG